MPPSTAELRSVLDLGPLPHLPLRHGRPVPIRQRAACSPITSDTCRPIIDSACRPNRDAYPDAVVTIGTFYDRMHPDDVEATRQAIDTAIASRVSYDTVHRTRRDEGGVRWIRAIGRAAYAPDGTPVRFDGVTVDVTSQKETEGMLREREAYFRSMADNAPAMLWVTDAQGRCTYLSRQWYEYTGRTPEQELGFGWLENIHPDDRQRSGDIFLGANARRVPFALDYRLRHRNGSYRWAVDAGIPRFDAAGEYHGFVGSVIDVHERKTVEQALAESDRRKDEFLATLAHELRNPLAPLLTALRLIEQSDRDEQITRRALGMMERQVAQLVRLVDDLLDVSRITRGKLQLRLERVTLAHVVQAAVEGAGAAIAKQGHRLTVTLPEEPVSLQADAARMSQVFLNLLNNAAKYTPAGGDVELRAEMRGDQVEIEVSDTGIGFDPDSAERLFEMFVQSEESRELAQGGLGIGLTLVRELVEAHQGSVSAHSEGRGRGSRFRITLPRLADTDAAEPVPPPPDTARPAPRRILIADDNVDAAASLALLLQRDGHDVRTAHDGEEALAVAAAFHPQVALLDIGMPRLNGYDTARRLRQLPSGAGMLVIALTGWGQPHDHERSGRHRPALQQAARAGPADAHPRRPLAGRRLRRPSLTSRDRLSYIRPSTRCRSCASSTRSTESGPCASAGRWCRRS